MSFSTPGYVFWDGFKYIIDGSVEIIGPPGPPGPTGPQGPQGPGGGGGSSAGACTLEQFGAVGDGITSDQAAYQAAFNALNAGTYSTLVLGPKTYLVSGARLNAPNITIVGQGQLSVLKTTSNGYVIGLYGPSVDGCLFHNFRLLGNNTGSVQNGIEVGYFGNDGALDLKIIGVNSVDMGGNGFSIAYGHGTIINGPLILGCRAINCTLHGFGAFQQANYVACQATQCGIGLFVNAGNVVWTGGDLTQNTVGVHLEGTSGNGQHGIVADSDINHCTTAVDCYGSVNGHTFASCHLYQGDINVRGTPGLNGLITFDNCVVDATNFLFDGCIAKFTNCRSPHAYFASYTEVNNPDVEWLNFRGMVDDMPSFIGTRVDGIFTFPTDSNQTLTKAQSRCKSLTIAPGIITTTREIVSTRSPNQGERFTVVNKNAQSVNYFWATGNGLTVPTNNTAMIGADGTDAKCIWISSNVATIVSPTGVFNPTTTALSGLYRGSYSAVPWAGTASAGTSGSHSLSSGGTAPTTGPAQNSLIPASFNGTNQSFKDLTTDVITTYLSATAYRVWVLFYAVALTADSFNPVSNPALITSDGGDWGIDISTNGVTGFQNTSGGYKYTPQVAITTGAYHLVDLAYDGVNLNFAVDGVAHTPAAAGSLTAPGEFLRVGSNWSAAKFFNGYILDIGIAPTALSTVSNADIITYVNNRYGLTL